MPFARINITAFCAPVNTTLHLDAEKFRRYLSVMVNEKGKEMRTSLTIDDDTAALVKEMASAQNRTTAGQIRHLIRTHPELIGWRSFKSHPEFQAAIAKANAVPANAG